jgi:hypothetical protein
MEVCYWSLVLAYCRYVTLQQIGVAKKVHVSRGGAKGADHRQTERLAGLLELGLLRERHHINELKQALAQLIGLEREDQGQQGSAHAKLGRR